MKKKNLVERVELTNVTFVSSKETATAAAEAAASRMPRLSGAAAGGGSSYQLSRHYLLFVFSLS